MFAAAAPAAELPVLPDQPLAPVAYVPSAGNDFPRAATNGDTVFVVWRVFGTRLIEGACLRHDGEVLSVPSILIGRDANPNTSPIVLWLGGHYLVLWSDASGKTFARRFASDGSAIDSVSRPTSISMRFVVVDGTNGMTVTNDAAGIAVQRIDADGQPLGASVHVASTGSVETAGASSRGVVILRNTWGAYDALFVGWDGTVLKITPISDSWSYGMLTEGGGRFLLTGGFRNARILDSDGTPLGPTQNLGDQTPLMRTAWNGTSWCVVRSNLSPSDYVASNAARIMADGRVDVSVGPPFGAGVNDLVWNGTKFVAISGVWLGVTARLFDTVEAATKPPRPIDVSLAAPEESDPMIASTTDRSLAVWRVRVDANTLALRGAFIIDGVLSAPFEIAPEIEDEAPAVATDGVDFLVAWRYGATISTRTVSSQQVLGAVQQIDTWAPRGGVGAVWSGQAWVVAYVDTFVHVVSLSHSGVLGDPLVVANPISVLPIASSVSLACDDTDCLLVTRLVEYEPGIGERPPTNTGTFAARVSRDGRKADPLTWIARNAVNGSPLAMRTGGVSVIISSEDGKSLTAVRLDTPAVKSLLATRTTSVRTVAVDRSGLYWSETQSDGSALLHWSAVSARQAPAITSTVDLGGAMPMPVAASSTSSMAAVLFSDGATDPELLAPRLYLRVFASPDPRAALASRRRATR